MKVFKFYMTAYIYSWTIWLSGIFLGRSSMNPYILVSLGGLGPVVGLLVYLKFFADAAVRLDYLHRLIRIKGIATSVWVFAISVPFAVVLLSNFLNQLLFGTSISEFHLFRLDSDFIAAGILYPFLLIFFGPIPEEAGWRGVAFEELMQKFGYVKTQLLVAILWAVWHFPLFMITGSYQSGLGLYTPEFWMFFINVLLNSFLTGWIYTTANRNIFLAIVFHYSVNLSGEMFPTTTTSSIIKLSLFFLLVIFCEVFKKPPGAEKQQVSPIAL